MEDPNKELPDFNDLLIAARIKEQEELMGWSRKTSEEQRAREFLREAQQKQRSKEKWYEPDATVYAWLRWVVRSIIGAILGMLILSAFT